MAAAFVIPLAPRATAGAGPFLTAETLNASVDGDAAYTYPGFGASGLTVKRIYVEGLLVNDELTTIFGDANSPLTIRSTSSQFFNGPAVGQQHTAPSEKHFETSPTLQWDTWLALGDMPFFVTPGFPNTALPDGGTNIANAVDIAWFAISGFVTPDGRALVGQFAFGENSGFEISISINVRRNGQPTEFRELTYTSGDPVDPTGACCIAGECAEMLQSECALATGTFSGADTLCKTVICDGTPSKSGACCVEGKCVEVTEAVCDLLGSVVDSVYHGDESLCSETDCNAEIPGACCIEGECVQVVASICAAAQGTFSGPGTQCADVTCTPPDLEGACCIFGECIQLTEQFCVLSTGEFYGVGTGCDVLANKCANGPPTTGACCIAGECTVTTQILCDQSFGEFQGLGTECADAECPAVGACCVDGVCVQLSEAICNLRGGQFSEEGIECGDVECILPDAIGTGCSAPFWRSPGLPRWPAPYRRSDVIAGVFTIPSCITDAEMHGRELHKGMSMFGGEGEMNKAARRLMREAVPALLNAQLTFSQKCGSDYPIGDPLLVVQLVNQTLATCDPSSVSLLTDTLGTYNSLGCATSRAGRCLDEDDRTRARGQPGHRE